MKKKYERKLTRTYRRDFNMQLFDLKLEMAGWGCREEAGNLRNSEAGRTPWRNAIHESRLDVPELNHSAAADNLAST